MLDTSEREKMIRQVLEQIKTNAHTAGSFELQWSEEELTKYTKNCEGISNAKIVDQLTQAIADMLVQGEEKLHFPARRDNMSKGKRLEKTDLQSVKEIAICFLYLPIDYDTGLPGLVNHPYTNSQVVSTKDTSSNIYLANLSDESNLIEWQKTIEHIILNMNNAHTIFTLIEKPFRLAFLRYTEQYLSVDDLSLILRDVWQTTEFPNTDPNISHQQLCRLFRECDPSVLMNDNERQAMNSLPDTVHVFRGVGSGQKKDIRALSWTLNPDMASWFAYRFDKAKKVGKIYVAEVSRSDILAYFDVGGEDEVVVNPKKLENIEMYR